MLKKIVIKYKKLRAIKEFNRQRIVLIKNNKESQLIIKHYRGCERGGLFLISCDIKQLKDLKKSLESRGYSCILLENFSGGVMDFKLNLTPNYISDENIEETINRFLSFTDSYFVNGRPIPNYDFFNDKEKDILKIWNWINTSYVDVAK